MKVIIPFGEVILIASLFFWPAFLAVSGLTKFDFWYVITMIAVSIFLGIGIGRKDIP